MKQNKKNIIISTAPFRLQIYEFLLRMRISNLSIVYIFHTWKIISEASFTLGVNEMNSICVPESSSRFSLFKEQRSNASG